MAERTIDIIYRFIADTREFEQNVKHATSQELGEIKAPSYKNLEKYLHGVEGELNRLVKLERLSADDASKIKKEYLAAAGAVDKMNAALAKRKGFEVYKADVQGKFVKANPQTAGMGNYPWQAQDPAQGAKKTLGEIAKIYNTGSHVAQQMSRYVTVAKTKLADFNVEARKVQVEAKKTRATLEEIGRAVMVKGFSFYGLRMTGASIAQQGQMASMVGGAISGGMFKMAADYIKNLQGATDTSREWAAQMSRVEAAQTRIGAVMASQSLPLLEKGADLLGRIASYAEKNPEQAGALMKGGLVLAGLGALLIVAGKGITLVSDIAFLTATVNMLKGGRDAILAAGSFRNSAGNMMKAAAIQAAAVKAQGRLTIGRYAPAVGFGTGGYSLAPTAGSAPVMSGGTPTVVATGGMGMMTVIADFAMAVSVFTGAVTLADSVMDKVMGHDATFQDYVTEIKQAMALNAKFLGDLFSGGVIKDRLGIAKMLGIPEDLGDQWFRKVRDALFKVDKDSHAAADGLAGISDILRNSLKRDEILAAYESYKADDLALVQKHYNDRKKIINDALNDTRKSNEKFAESMRKIAQTMSKQLGDASRDYQSSEAKAERDYASQRAEIIRENGEAIVKIEQDLQERLRKLELEHIERRTDLLAARDAVGLVKEKKRYQQEVSEAQREAQREMAERRQEGTRRLEELRIQYEQERVERLAEYQARIAEIRENARQEMLELQRQHAEELREIQINRNNRLRELDVQLAEERNRRRDAFLAQVRDLDATLLGEENLRKDYQNRMLKELDSFLSKYRAGMGSLLTAASSAGSRQSGGYVAQGMYKLHNGEYVVNPSTTRTLEQLIGGQLTQAGLIQMAHNSRSSVTWNDSRRFDSRLQASDRRMIYNDTLEIIEKVVTR